MSTRTQLRHPGTHEQLIAALLPDVAASQPNPGPAPMPSLSAPSPSSLTASETLLLGTARIDRSGRVHERTLFRVLGWVPGHELTIDTVDDMIVIGSLSGGGHRIDDRSALALPVARRPCSGPDVRRVHPGRPGGRVQRDAAGVRVVLEPDRRALGYPTLG